ncbi:hypothetical protein ABZ636_36960 [Streptomyces sp. NPDC007251]|uniref:hypothetical protein n=1 Tax=Streptomyces sp. NPDC007251 TaxID=3154483 RepID=UPI0033DCAA0A
MTAQAPTTDTTNLSVECLLGREPGYEDVHGECRQTNDVPLPYGRGILLARRCCCTCHRQAKEPS